MNPTLAIIATAAIATYALCGIAILQTLRKRYTVRMAGSTPGAPASVEAATPDMTCVMVDMASSWWVEVTDGANSRSMPLLPGRVVIGSGSRSDIRLEDPFVSAQHLSLRVGQDGSLLVTDLDSTNGTFANGSRISRHVGSHGDRIKLGRTTLRFTHADGAAIAAALD